MLHQHPNSHEAYFGIPPENFRPKSFPPKKILGGLNFQVGCQDRLCVNSDANEGYRNGIAEVSEVLTHEHFNFN